MSVSPRSDVAMRYWADIPGGQYDIVQQQIHGHVRNLEEGPQVKRAAEADEDNEKQHGRHSAVELAARAAPQ